MRISDWGSDLCSSDLQVFAKGFKAVATRYGTEATDIPADWLRAVAEKYLTPEEMAAIEALGSWDEIMETLKKRLEEQQGRHQGGNKWIGTGGTSPSGNSGYNPDGVRIGGGTTHKRALTAWDQSAYSTLHTHRPPGTPKPQPGLGRPPRREPR